MAYTGTGRDVADPWYTGDFEEAFQDILEGCEGMMRLWKRETTILWLLIDIICQKVAISLEVKYEIKQ